jgi:hypothetical protein
MPRLHDLCSEIASSEGMAILNSVELECMIYSKLSDRYKGIFFFLVGLVLKIHLAVVASNNEW